MLISLLGGCNWAFGLAPVGLADGGADDAIAADAAARCDVTQTLGAGAPRAVGFGAETLEADAVAAQGNSHYVVGWFRDRGVVLKRDAVAPAAWLIQAGVTDQLWGIAPGTMNALAVGASRTTTGTPHDRGVIAMISGNLAPKAWLIEDGVQSVQLSAVHSPGDAWFVAGRHQGGTRVVVAQLGLDHDVVDARSLALDPTLLHQVFDLVATNTRVFVAGQLGPAAAPSASFVVGLTRGNLAKAWVRHPDFTVVDVAVDGEDLVATGFRGGDGVIARLSPVDGALRSAQLLPGKPLHGMIVAGADRWIVGAANGGGTFVGRLEGACATITPHATVLGATAMPRPPVVVAGGGVATLYGANLGRTKIVQRLLDGNGASTCAATAEGALAVPTPVAVAAGAATSTAVTLTTTAIPTAQITAATPTDEATCE